jgi:hypothetical protein
MTEPPPLLAHLGTSRSKRIILAVASLVAIITGQCIKSGTLYYGVCVSIAANTVLRLLTALDGGADPPGYKEGYFLAAFLFVGPVFWLLLVFAFYYGLLVAAGCALSLAFETRPSRLLSRIASFSLAALAVCMLLGLGFLTFQIGDSHQDGGEPKIEPYLFLWPATFFLLAFAYGRVFPEAPHA